jgi:hypothetical protein
VQAVEKLPLQDGCRRRALFRVNLFDSVGLPVVSGGHRTYGEILGGKEGLSCPSRRRLLIDQGCLC